MTQFLAVLLVIGGVVLGLGLLSQQLKRWGLPDPLLVLLLGIALGPHGADLLKPAEWGAPDTLLERAAQLTLAIGLMGVALRIPKHYPRQNWRPLLLLLAVAMPFMWLSSSLLVYLLLGLPLWTTLLIGAIITPTDPIVASSIVTGKVASKNLPERLRHLLSAESGFNDGLALPFVMLPVLFLTAAPDAALHHWLTHVLLWKVGGALGLGFGIGWVSGYLLQRAEEHDWIEEASILDYTTALAIFTLAVVELLGSNGILAVFLAGLAFDQVVGASERSKEERVVEGIDRFFTLPIFGLLGLLLPWHDWHLLGWNGVLLIVAVLLLRRLPVFLLLAGRLRPLPHRSDGLFLGWFGPMGVTSLYYASLALRHTGEQQLWVVASLLVTASVLAHGITATPATRLYGGLNPPPPSDPEDPEDEPAS